MVQKEARTIGFKSFCNFIAILFGQLKTICSLPPLSLHPMKFFSLIMSFYLLLLPFIPCRDSNDLNAKQEVKISTASHQHQEHESETCSPMCACSCCAVSVDANNTITYNIPPPAFKQVKFYSRPNFYQFDFNSIWQPPKIG